MGKVNRRRYAVAALLVSLAHSAVAAEDSATTEPAATPYRPSVSTPATLSAPGWLEAEFGVQRVEGGDAARRDSLPYTLKLAFTPDWGVRVGGDLHVTNTDSDGTRLSGVGDTALIVKRRFAVNEAAAFGVEAGVIAATAKNGLGVGRTAYSVNGIYSADLGKYHLDINVAPVRLGEVDAGQGRYQTTWAGALSRPLNERWSVVGEFSGTRQVGVPGSAQFLLAASYNLSKRIVFDVGASRGLNRNSPDWSLFGGVTVLLGRVF